MGCGALIAPLLVTRQFDIVELTRAGRNEIRAVYGGFGLAIAAILALASSAPDLRAGICFSVAAALAGMAFGRIVSLIADRGIGRTPASYMILEAAAALSLVYAA